MKINFIIPSTVLGGGVRMVFVYANYLSKKGHDVMVYVPMIFAWKDINNGKINIKTSLANTLKRGTHIDWFDCCFPIRKAFTISDKYIRDADVTVATAWYTAHNVLDLSPEKGKKCYFIQDYEVCESGENKDIVENTYRFPMHKITIAKWLDDIVRKVSGDSTFILLNGIDDNEFIKEEKRQTKRISIIMLGNMAPHKGTKGGIEILKHMQEKYNVRVIVYASTSSNEFPPSFEFYLRPERKKLMELYTEADICLFPSLREGWGLTVTEAMAHKCAIVGNNTGVVSEIGVDGENMLINYDFSKSGLEALLEKVISDKALREKLQNNAYITAIELKSDMQGEKLEKYLINSI